MAQRFLVPPNWPSPPEGWTPPAGWRPDPAWGPEPPGWQFWASHDLGSPTLAANCTDLPSGPLSEVVGHDGRIALDGDRLVLTFTDSWTANPLKKALGVRSYPLVAVADLRISPDGHRGHPTLQVLVREGSDLLRPLLKNSQPGPDGDPDMLILRKGGTVAVAEAFAAAVRARQATAPEQQSGIALVDSGRLPLTVNGNGTRATFDGATVTLEVSSMAASAAMKNAYPRRIPAAAVANVRLVHPRMTGQLRFLLAGGPGPEAPVDPRTDLDTVKLNADTGQSYSVLAAAVLTAGRRAGVIVHPHLLPAAPAPAPVPGPPPPPARIAAPASIAGPPLSLDDTTPFAPIAPPAPAAAPFPSLDRTPPARVAAPALATRSAPPEPRPVYVPDPEPVAANPAWRERRAERRAAKQHTAAVAAWKHEQDLLDRLADAALAAAGRRAGARAGIILKPGEVALWSGPASLIEPRRQPGRYVGGSSGVSVKVAPGVRIRSSSSRGRYEPGPEEQAISEDGSVVVTGGRVVFTGSRQHREWLFSKLVGLRSNPDYEYMLIAVANRQKTSGVHVGAARGEEFCRFVQLGVAIAQHGAARLVAETEMRVEEHWATRP